MALTHTTPGKGKVFPIPKGKCPNIYEDGGRSMCDKNTHAVIWALGNWLKKALSHEWSKSTAGYRGESQAAPPCPAAPFPGLYF